MKRGTRSPPRARSTRHSVEFFLFRIFILSSRQTSFLLVQSWRKRFFKGANHDHSERG